MAQFCSNSIVIWPLLLSCLCLNLARNMAEFPRIEHYSKRNVDPIAFLVVGDWGRGGNFNQSRVASQMGDIGKKLGINFVISTGDNFYDDGLKGVNDPFFQRSFTGIYTAKSLQKPWYTVLGNHDYQGNTEAQLSPVLRKLDSRWRCKRNFIVGAGIVDIVFIDTTPFVGKYFNHSKNQKFDWKDVLPRDNYLSALRKSLHLALSKSRAPWKIVVGHHTIRSIGHHGDTQEIVDQLLPILEAHKVDMYINGHDHCLQHLSNKKGTMHFLTSGGGSKAWKNDIHYGKNNDTVHFYYDGQGFMSVSLTHWRANVLFYDVSGKPLYHMRIRNPTCILLLLIACLFVSKVTVTARLVQIQQRIRLNRVINFLAVGDWGRKGAFNQSAVARSMGEVGAKLRIDFVVSTGDNFYKDGLTGVRDPAFAQSFTKIYTARSLQKPWYATLGNHDYHGDSAAQLSPLLRKRDRRWNCYRSYTVRAGFLQIFFVDTSPFKDKYFDKGPNKFNWTGVLPRDTYISNLAKDLDTALKTSKAAWKIVVGHHPIRSIGKQGDTEELLEKLLPILEANKIPIYINGHNHCLEHINNTGISIEFLTSGGGSRAWGNIIHYDRYKNNLKFYYDGQGFISVRLTKRQANVVFYDVSGQTLHSFELKKFGNRGE
ncbi:Purple acid phosphatase 3 [Sesamum alatum]|uniref:acid phosphatase n=1 Tax=Sesamum alatum TaxID=300844 RepID=A0AAE1YV81_9LAMI|nr:Purple acid phosphatase 3 [Sesamum alatum]